MLAVSVILLAHPLVGLKLPSLKTDLKLVPSSFITPVVQAQKVGLDKCKTCIDFAGQALNQLLNIILRKYSSLQPDARHVRTHAHTLAHVHKKVVFLFTNE